MARLKHGLLGGISGKIGDVIGYIRYGMAYVKKKSMKPQKEATGPQLAEREKMRIVNRFVNSMTEFVRIGFALEAAEKPHSANSAAKSYQLKNAISGEYPALEIDYSKVLLSKGKIEKPLNVTMIVQNNGVTFNWELSRQTSVYYKRSRVMLLVYAPAVEKSVFTLSGARIADKTAFLELPESFKDQLLHTYITFHSDNQKQISDSSYAGAIIY